MLGLVDADGAGVEADRKPRYRMKASTSSSCLLLDPLLELDCPLDHVPLCQGNRVAVQARLQLLQHGWVQRSKAQVAQQRPPRDSWGQHLKAGGVLALIR